MFAAPALAGPLLALFSQIPASMDGHHHSSSPSPAATRTHTQTPAPAGVAGKGPALSISVSDGRRSARPGDLLTYTIQIRNIGTASATGLRIVGTLPPQLKMISATRHAVARSGQLTWQLSLPTHRTSTFRVAARVGQTPKQLLRLAFVACASGRHGSRPIVCAAHSDLLPAGAMAAANAGHAAPPATAGSHTRYLKPVLTAFALVLTAAAGGWLMLRRRPRQTS